MTLLTTSLPAGKSTEDLSNVMVLSLAPFRGPAILTSPSNVFTRSEGDCHQSQAEANDPLTGVADAATNVPLQPVPATPDIQSTGLVYNDFEDNFECDDEIFQEGKVLMAGHRRSACIATAAQMREDDQKIHMSEHVMAMMPSIARDTATGAAHSLLDHDAKERRAATQPIASASGGVSKTQNCDSIQSRQVTPKKSLAAVPSHDVDTAFGSVHRRDRARPRRRRVTTKKSPTGVQSHDVDTVFGSVHRRAGECIRSRRVTPKKLSVAVQSHDVDTAFGSVHRRERAMINTADNRSPDVESRNDVLFRPPVGLQQAHSVGGASSNPDELDGNDARGPAARYVEYGGKRLKIVAMRPVGRKSGNVSNGRKSDARGPAASCVQNDRKDSKIATTRPVGMYDPNVMESGASNSRGLAARRVQNDRKDTQIATPRSVGQNEVSVGDCRYLGGRDFVVPPHDVDSVLGSEHRRGGPQHAIVNAYATEHTLVSCASDLVPSVSGCGSFPVTPNAREHYPVMPDGASGRVPMVQSCAFRPPDVVSGLGDLWYNLNDSPDLGPDVQRENEYRFGVPGVSVSSEGSYSVIDLTAFGRSWGQGPVACSSGVRNGQFSSLLRDVDLDQEYSDLMSATGGTRMPLIGETNPAVGNGAQGSSPVVQVSAAQLGDTGRGPHAVPNFIHYECFCGRIFSSNCGLEVHMQNAHPTELIKQKMSGRHKRVKWTSQEDTALLRWATELSCRFGRHPEFYANLGEQFPRRTVTALMRRLRILKWDFREMIVVDDTAVNNTARATADPVPQEVPWEEIISIPEMLNVEPQEVDLQVFESILTDMRPLVFTDEHVRALYRSRSQSTVQTVRSVSSGELAESIRIGRSTSAVGLKAGMQLIVKPWTRWSRNDKECLLLMAAEQRPSTSRTDVAERLMPFFPGRTKHAIRQKLSVLRERGKLIEPGSREQEMSMECPVAVGALEEGSESVIQHTPWVDEMLSSIKSGLSGKQAACLGGTKLAEIVEALVGGSSTLLQLPGLLEEHASRTFRSVKVRDRGQKPKQKRALRGDVRRKVEYASLQAVYRKKRREAARVVLEGSWKEMAANEQEVTEETTKYWRGVLAREGKTDPRNVIPGEQFAELQSPVTTTETKCAIRAMRKDTAPGLDGLTPKSLKRFPLAMLTSYLNLMFLAGSPPQKLLDARITLIPKCAKPTKPTDYRPIAVTSVIVRCLHKVLATRWQSKLKPTTLQVAFLKRDGCLEASEVLHTVLRDAHRRKRGLCGVFLDVSKAFDSVSHETIFRNAESFGAPPHLLKYLVNSYQASRSLIAGEFVSCKRGVRQGDPLSPLLFIMAMDEVLQGSVPQFGYTLGQCIVDSIGYADDLVLLAETIERLWEKMQSTQSQLEKAGMTVNAAKSVVLRMEADTKSKQVFLVPTRVDMGGSTIPALGPSKEVRYLGLSFSWKGKVEDGSVAHMCVALERIAQAPLKPIQRREILINHLLPSMIHRLVLGTATRSTLRTIDWKVRKAYREFAKMPKDATTAFLHTPVRFGGAGVPCLSTQIPLLQYNRFGRMLTVDHPIIKEVCSTEDFKQRLIRMGTPVKVGKTKTIANNKMEVAEAWRTNWRACADGADVPEALPTWESVAWVNNPGRMFPAIYIRCIKLRGGCLATEVRRTRGRATRPVMCKYGCGMPGDIGHIMQKCMRTHAARCLRHNTVSKALAGNLRRIGLMVLEEPRVPFQGSFLKPDLIVIKEGVAYVVDTTVVSGRRLRLSWDLKIAKYSETGFPDAIIGQLGERGLVVQTVVHIPFVVSFTGVVNGDSIAGLKRLGLSRYVLRDLGILCMRGSLRCYDVFTKCT